MTKNLGPSVSGYDEPAGRAWETTVFQAGKEVLDRELNLGQDINISVTQSALRSSICSGFLSKHSVRSSDPTAEIFGATSVANTLNMSTPLLAHVNGWLINVRDTNGNASNGANVLNLGVGPSGVGSKRTDLVILEVWRRLISAAPDTTGKSASGRIFQNGNVKISAADDLTLNFLDDILDGSIGAETTKRVQIQYRLRVISGVDLFSAPYGLSPSVTANTVPANAATPDGAVPAVPLNYTYLNQSANGDPGLWRAGDGNPANELGTVDGYMYAIPVTAVFRRNSDPFDRIVNQNGGVVAPTTSDRPDGLHSDIIDAKDLFDLRLCVSLTGWSLNEVLEKNVQYLLDNTLRTEIVDTSLDGGGGSHGTEVLRVNEIGGPSTAAGALIGQFDAVRRHFSDRPTMEVTTVVLNPTGSWNDGESVVINPTQLTVYPHASYNWAALAPAKAQFVDVVGLRWVSTTNTNQCLSAVDYVASISGLASDPVGPVTIQFGTLPVGLTTEKLYVDLLVSYPGGQGLTHTPTESFGSASVSIIGANPSGASPVSFASLTNTSLDFPHREVNVEYATGNLTWTLKAELDNPQIVHLPERANTIVSVTVNAAPAGSFTLSASGRVITIGSAVSAGQTIVITYTAIRPMTHIGTPKVAVYYKAAAMQTAREGLLTNSLSVLPRVFGQQLITITAGSGSQGESYPYPVAYLQTGGTFPSLIGTYSGDSDLVGGVEIQLHDFEAQTGLLNLPVYVPMAPKPDSLVFQRNPGDADLEKRTYYNRAAPGSYLPNAYAQNLASPDRHKNVYVVLAELGADSLLGMKGQLVMLVFSRYAKLDGQNSVFFDPDLNVCTTTMSVVRVKGFLLTKGSN